jgi:hypothetical protein
MIAYLQKANPPALNSAEPWLSPYGDGIKLTTRHYEIYTTWLEPLTLVQVPAFLESAYRGYQSQLPRPLTTESKFDVYLFKTRQQWEHFTDDFAGENAHMYKKIKKGAYCLKGACVAYNIGLNDVFSALGHEGWHQFTKKHFAFRLPSWLDEGVAMLFEVHQQENGFYRFDPSRNLSRLASLKKTLQDGNTIRLTELISLNPGEALMDDEQSEGANGKVGAFYSQSYALVRFLREDNYGMRLGNYLHMMQDGLTGNWPMSDAVRRFTADRNIPMTVGMNRMIGRSVFVQYIGNDVGSIEEQYLQFCRKITYPVVLKN